MLKKVSLNKTYTFLIGFLFFLIPSNLFLKINISAAYVNGLLVDYLIPKLYLSDIIVLILLSLWLIEVMVKKKKIVAKTSGLLLPSILFSLIIIRQIFTPHPLAATWYLIKLIEMGFLGWFLFTHQKLLRKPLVYFATLATILFQSSLAIWQFFSQRSFSNYLFLGEVNLTRTIGLAKDIWWHTGRVLPYGTTAHPNILGGILVIYCLFLITQKKQSKVLAAATYLLAIAVIILTQSISAMLTLAIGLFLITRKKINYKSYLYYGGIVFFLTPLIISLATKQLPSSDSITRRSYLQNSALNMFLDNPMVGVGLNQFTTRVEEYSNVREVVRFVQPVHHIGWLWIAETGILGILLIWLLAKKINYKKIILPLLILLPIATLDHYLLTQQSGLLLMIFSTPMLMASMRG